MAKVIYKVGDDVSTDVIYPGRFMATVLPSETPKYAFADDLEFNTMLQNDDASEPRILVGANNFGCGSSREQAASCLKGHNLIIIANDIARIFLQNAVNLGLQTISAPDFECNVGDDIEIEDDRIINKTTGKSYNYTPLSPARQAIVDAGGLIPYAREKLLEMQG